MPSPADPDSPPLTVGQWLEHWLVSRTAPRSSTLRGYAAHVRLYLAPCLGQILLADLSPAHVQAMFTAITRQHEAIYRPVTSATLVRVKATLQTALNGAIRAGHVAMLVLGIIAVGGEYRYKTIIRAMLVVPRRGALMAAKVTGISVAGAVLSVLTFGVGLATAVAELSARHVHHLPADTGTLFAGSVIAGALFGVIGVALGYITRSTIAAVAGAVGWVLFAEPAILHTLAPHLAKWLVTGAATTLTDPGVLASRALTPATAVAVLTAYTAVLLTAATALVLRRDVAWPRPQRRRPERTRCCTPSTDTQNVLIRARTGLSGTRPQLSRTSAARRSARPWP